MCYYSNLALQTLVETDTFLPLGKALAFSLNSTFNNTNTRQCGQRTLASYPISRFSYKVNLANEGTWLLPVCCNIPFLFQDRSNNKKALQLIACPCFKCYNKLVRINFRRQFQTILASKCAENSLIYVI